MTRLKASLACPFLLLGLVAGCGAEDTSAEPREPATVTLSPDAPSAASQPPPTTRAPAPKPAPKPAPVDLSGYDLPGFTTPSANIGCQFDSYDGPHVRCDRLEMDGPLAGKPADCDFDWGHSVELSAGDRGAIACTSDSVMGQQGETDGTRALPYGDSVRYRGIVCTSATNGLRCRTSGGHGFLISRATIEVR